ncbi:hypothetical protein A0257_09855 [Hymenobacter psoromatis]|nr:hypothetical protein A0257_09855 [Hymenobacter psoromatis]
MLYNTFEPTKDPQSGTGYFILYNKYRGVMRLYYHVSDRQSYVASNDLFHTIHLHGSYASSSPFLNFSGPQIIDINQKLQNSYIVVEKGRAIASNTWYACEVELAYDPNMAAQNFNSVWFDWELNGIQVSQLKAKGTVMGNITGNISMPSSSFSYTGGAVTTSNIETLLNIDGKTDVNGPSGGGGGLFSTLTKAAGDGLTSAITSGVSGLATNLFSSIFGGDSNQPNTNLKLQADISMTGTLLSTGAVTDLQLVPSGIDQSQTKGYVPAYTKALGVFYISSGLRFTREHHIVQHANQPSTDTYFVQPDYNPNIGRLVINPEVTNLATVDNYSEELVSIENGGANADISGHLEVIGDRPTVDASGNDVGATPITYRIGTFLQSDNIYPGIVGIRIGFDVTPKDGKSPKVRITKTFTATLVDSGETIVTDPPGQDPY